MKIKLLLVILTIFACSYLFAGTETDNIPQTGTTPSGSHVNGNDAPPTQRSKKPNIQYGFEERVRTEAWDNAADFDTKADDVRQQIRFRSRLWLTLNTETTDFAVKLNNEFRKQFAPTSRLNNDETVFENLYVDFKKTFIKGFSARIGRQDLMRGEGFILYDGTPNEGSRTFYFNAADFSFSFRKSKLELIGILNPRQDRFLPRIHDQRKWLQDWDEQAVGLYYTDKNNTKTDLDAYYFYKREINDRRVQTSSLFQPNRYVSTLGARVVRRLRTDLSITGEFASQWGSQHTLAGGSSTTSIGAWAGYAYVKKNLSGKMNPYVLGGTWLFSGDDPSSYDRIEGFDPVFSRWPKWGDLGMYSQAAEYGLSYWTNNRMVQAEFGISPWRPVKMRATFYSEHAFHPYARGTTSVFGNGTHRGEDLQIRLDYTVNRNVKGHVVYENMFPGSFYTVRSNAYFFRAEIIYSLQGTFGRNHTDR